MEPDVFDDLPAEPEAAPTVGEQRLYRALRDLIAAIDFEGANGGLHFNPGTPYELEVLSDARLVADAYVSRLF